MRDNLHMHSLEHSLKNPLGIRECGPVTIKYVLSELRFAHDREC